ncbi:MAG: copper homeostasis protein CutC [Bacteroidota bacterium]
MIVEICANSYESALVAQNTGADRIELCTDLSVGGLTPSRREIEKVMQKLSIPTHVLIRPRPGDFCYSEAELETMLKDIAFCKELGCAGVVSGVLSTNNMIAPSESKRLIEASQGMEFTFHRAFDQAISAPNMVNLLMSFGVTRLLSSGRELKAIDGINFLKNLNEFIGDKVQIMPGGGINSENALAFKEAGFKMIHLSATKKTATNGMFDSKVEGHSDPAEIEQVIQLLS